MFFIGVRQTFAFKGFIQAASRFQTGQFQRFHGQAGAYPKVDKFHGDFGIGAPVKFS